MAECFPEKSSPMDCIPCYIETYIFSALHPHQNLNKFTWLCLQLFAPEQHAEKVRQHKQGMGGDTRLGGREEEATEDEVWKRLEELERWESERGELGR